MIILIEKIEELKKDIKQKDDNHKLLKNRLQDRIDELNNDNNYNRWKDDEEDVGKFLGLSEALKICKDTLSIYNK